MAKADAILFLVALVLLWLVLPHDAAGVWGALGVTALPLSVLLERRWPSRALRLPGALLASLSLAMLALESPATWCSAGISALCWTAAASSFRTITRRQAALVLGVGLATPLLLGAVLWLASESARLLLAGALRRSPFDARALHELGQWSATVLVLLAATTPANARTRERWLLCSTLGVCGVLLVSRSLWLVSRLGLRTDMTIWSEPPLLLNLLKLRAGEIFYGPLSRPNSYSYSPALEHLQYWLLEPWGLELSLIAHRVLGVVWQLASAWILASALSRWLAPTRAGKLGLWACCLGVLLSSLLAPHLHPDHLLFLVASGVYWLVLRREAWTRRELLLLVSLPALATMTKLTGAGLGLGLGLAYAVERDTRKLAWLVPAAALALGTIGLFDATLGHFSDYAIKLQASHPIERDRALGVWSTPPLLAFFVAGVACVARGGEPGLRDASRAARRAWLLTLGFGIPSLLAYAKHGGRQNSLLPFSVGAAIVLLLLSGSDDPAKAARGWPRAALAAALLAIVTPISPALWGARREPLVRMHQTAVSWLRESARQHHRVFSSSTAARIDAGLLQVPDVSLHSISELVLGKYAAGRLLEQRVRARYYDGLLLSAGALEQNPAVASLRPSLMRDYVVIAPPELHGAWPTGVEGYVIIERRASPAAPATPHE